jgi:hypothetical protein
MVKELIKEYRIFKHLLKQTFKSILKPSYLIEKVNWINLGAEYTVNTLYFTDKHNAIISYQLQAQSLLYMQQLCLLEHKHILATWKTLNFKMSEFQIEKQLEKITGVNIDITSKTDEVSEE